MPLSNYNVAWKTGALTILPKAKRKRKRKSMALDNNLVAPPPPKKPKTPCIIKAPIPEASYSGLRSSTKSSPNISPAGGSGGA
jgi:hypothetical protein